MTPILLSFTSVPNAKTVPHNKATDFTYILPTPLRLGPGDWRVSLVHFMTANYPQPHNRNMTRGDTDARFYFVYCDLCDVSLVDGERRPLLAIMTKKSHHLHYSLERIPVPIRPRHEIRSVRIWVVAHNAAYTDVSFSGRSSRCTLLIEKAPVRCLSTPQIAPASSKSYPVKRGVVSRKKREKMLSREDGRRGERTQKKKLAPVKRDETDQNEKPPVNEQ